ncbi:MAG: DUF4351 domain-containing protein [Sandaracinaceae bacterium]|nr:DUF4351 domain-containing protein [Sandaracinaceae bacterium]
MTERPEWDEEGWALLKEALDGLRASAAHFGPQEVRRALAESRGLPVVVGDEKQVGTTRRGFDAVHAIADAYLHAVEVGEVPGGPEAARREPSGGESAGQHSKVDAIVDKAQELVLKQLRVRFGELPEATIARVRVASVEELDRWAERVLTASSLEQVFA